MHGETMRFTRLHHLKTLLTLCDFRVREYKSDTSSYFNPRNEIDTWHSHTFAEICQIIDMYLPSELPYKKIKKYKILLYFKTLYLHHVKSLRPLELNLLAPELFFFKF